MAFRSSWNIPLRLVALLLVFAFPAALFSRAPAPTPPPKKQSAAAKKNRKDDSLDLQPAKDLLLKETGRLKADALAEFVRGADLEESGETEKALTAYRHVLNVDPGQVELAVRVADILTRQNDYPEAIDVLKDAIKANGKRAEPFLALAAIYADYLKKTDQAVDYANRAIAIDPAEISSYSRLCEIYADLGETAKARQTVERAMKVQTDDPVFWARLGKLYGALATQSGEQQTPQDAAKISEIFKKAADNAKDDPNILRDIADYYSSSKQVKEAIPLYLRVLELQPDDASAREKLAKGFVETNQQAKAIETLEAIIKEHPEKYQSYDLLAEVLEDQGNALLREKKMEEAKSIFKKAAASYEQSLLVNPTHAVTYVRLARILLGPVIPDPEHAAKLLGEARRRFPESPEMVYYLALALREAKHTQEALTTFEEALHEAELDAGEMVNAQFYFDYGATAEQGGLYDKAAELFKKAIYLDPANSTEACNYLAYMWANQNTHLEEAADLIKRALQSDPNNGAYLDTQGWIEYRQGKFDQALTDLQHAAQAIGREDAVVFEHLGDTYSKLKRLPEALEAWQKASKLDPKNKNLADKIANAQKDVNKPGDKAGTGNR